MVPCKATSKPEYNYDSAIVLQLNLFWHCTKFTLLPYLESQWTAMNTTSFK